MPLLDTSLRPQTRPAFLDTTAPEDAAPTDIVRREATERVSLPRTGRLLLGTFGEAEALQAILRDPNGKVRTVSKGDRLGRDLVIAIEEGRVALRDGASVRWLTMPGA